MIVKYGISKQKEKKLSSLDRVKELEASTKRSSATKMLYLKIFGVGKTQIQDFVRNKEAI